MIIDHTNYEIGNKAMANVLLLYYHLLDEGGITNDQTIYLNQNEFDGFNFLATEVREKGNEGLDLNEALINEGAIIYLLCELNDIISEHDQDYRIQPLTQKICAALEVHQKDPIPEVGSLLKEILVAESDFHFTLYNKILQGIYKKYVHGFFAAKLTVNP